MKILSLAIMIFSLNACAGDYFYEYGKKVELSPISSPRSLNSSDIRFYKTRDGRKIGIKNEIIVKLKKGIEPKAFFAKYNLSKVEKLSSSMYLIKLDKNQNVFKLSQEMYQDNDTEFAVPNKVQKYFVR